MNWFCTFLTEAKNPPAVNLFDYLMWFMLFGYGGYALYIAIRLRVTWMLFPNKFLYPGNCSMEACVDEDGFFDYIMPRIAIWGTSMIIIGAFLVVNSFFLKLSGLWFTILITALPVAIIIWYIVIQHKAAKRFW